MAAITVRGHRVDVDVRAELERFNWQRARWDYDKLIACSPFRYDKSPSFFVRIEPHGDLPAGVWSDSGAYDQEWQSGGLIKLLSFLEDCTAEEVEERLLSEYASELLDGSISLEMPKLKLAQRVDRRLDEGILNAYKFRHPYLERRGILELTQKEMKVGYCKESQAVTIPWFDERGRLANVKYRKVNSKIFWYHKGAIPIRQLVYGMNIVNARKSIEAVICEAEIDAMTIRSATGKDAIAVGGANFTDFHADIIKRSTLKSLVVCADNDKTGEKMRDQVVKKLRGCVELSEIKLPSRYKDINEAHLQEDITRFFVETPSIRQLSI